MVIDSDSEDAKKDAGGIIRQRPHSFYYGQDLIGNEIGAAAKNVVALLPVCWTALGFRR